MRKVYLLSTVAAAVLMSAGAASAQGMQQGTPDRSPAAQQQAPAEKMAPAMKGHEGAPRNSQRAPARGETTGQAPGSSGREQGRAMDKGRTENGQPMRKGEQPNMNRPAGANGMNAQPKSGAAEGKPGGTAQSNTGRATTGQGAAGAARLTTEQRTKITTIFKQHKVAPAQVNFSVRVGARVPERVHFYPVPTEVVTVYPEWRGFDYIVVGDQIVVIDPATHEIVAVLEA